MARNETFALCLDGDFFELDGSTTLGRHLDNDIVVAGEDVLDYHVRIEPHDRGATVYPLGNATFRLAGVERSKPAGLIPGDRIELGQVGVTFERTQGDPEEVEWYLVDVQSNEERHLDALTSIGRSRENTLRIDDDHISRRHAELVPSGGEVWLRDLVSANGSYVNGQRLNGGCRLFHGDEFGFDAYRYQLIGRGGDLTPVRLRQGQTGEQLVVAPLRGGGTDTTQIAVVREDDITAGQMPADPTQAGCYLLGISDEVQGEVFAAPLGRMVIGRGRDCDIRVDDTTVSARHAELTVRAEGCSVSNLMSTNGTRVNGQEIQTTYLSDGDVLRLGQVRLVFREVQDTEETSEGTLRTLRRGLLIAAGVLGVALALALLI